LEVSVYRADPTTWLDVITALSPILGALLAVGGVLLTLRSNNRRERDRQEHERLLKDAELEAARVARLRDERREAYIAYMAVCDRLHGGDHSPEARAELRKIVEVVELVSLSKEVQDSIRELTNHLIVRTAPSGETEAVSLPDESAYRARLGNFKKAIKQDLGITSAAMQDPA
jgi:hypothetical protein